MSDELDTAFFDTKTILAFGGVGNSGRKAGAPAFRNSGFPAGVIRSGNSGQKAGATSCRRTVAPAFQPESVATDTPTCRSSGFPAGVFELRDSELLSAVTFLPESSSRIADDDARWYATISLKSIEHVGKALQTAINQMIACLVS